VLQISSKKSKNKISRLIPPLDTGVETLQEYLSGFRAKHGGPWLFPSTDGDSKHVDTSTIRRKMRIVRNKLGLAELTPHTMRHTYVTLLNKYGVSPLTIAALAGHKSLNTSLI
jgi:integrase